MTEVKVLFLGGGGSSAQEVESQRRAEEDSGERDAAQTAEPEFCSIMQQQQQPCTAPDCSLQHSEGLCKVTSPITCALILLRLACPTSGRRRRPGGPEARRLHAGAATGAL
ncbi:hypothetical protein EYF80_060087 [Liparis tanakae]|uniref:Uncharacterized protein n=1 Tax=Liparis tanakae TaxID=230148 RepID=A0A4Z2ELN8_9TELE|nr:hypothetical protein EYF80_060087 [Liparis tanakae]